MSSGDSNDSEEYEELTPQHIYNRLKISWLNEKMSPEILENDDDITENALELIEAMEANLRPSHDSESTIRNSIHSLEVARVKYCLTSYIRERINKIEKRPAYILNDRNKRNLLSEKEIEFAQRIVNLQLEHLQSEVLNKVEQWNQNQDIDISKLAKWGKHYPDDKYVCIRFLEDFELAESVDLQEDERKYKKEDCLIMRWKYGKDPIFSGKAALI
jgi:DNA replication initiation complex subunit (GINS family)